MISDQSIRLRNGWKIWKQNITSTAIRPARISTSSRPRDSALSEVGVGCIDSLLAGGNNAARDKETLKKSSPPRMRDSGFIAEQRLRWPEGESSTRP
ncbi:hypothetical protein D3C80_971120 [compost metagenome]